MTPAQIRRQDLQPTRWQSLLCWDEFCLPTTMATMLACVFTIRNGRGVAAYACHHNGFCDPKLSSTSCYKQSLHSSNIRDRNVTLSTVQQLSNNNLPTKPESAVTGQRCILTAGWHHAGELFAERATFLRCKGPLLLLMRSSSSCGQLEGL